MYPCFTDDETGAQRGKDLIQNVIPELESLSSKSFYHQL